MEGNARRAELRLEGSRAMVARVFCEILKRHGKRILEWYATDDGRQITILFQESAQGQASFASCWKELDTLRNTERSLAETVEILLPDNRDWEI